MRRGTLGCCARSAFQPPTRVCIPPRDKPGDCGLNVPRVPHPAPGAVPGRATVIGKLHDEFAASRYPVIAIGISIRSHVCRQVECLEQILDAGLQVACVKKIGSGRPNMRPALRLDGFDNAARSLQLTNWCSIPMPLAGVLHHSPDFPALFCCLINKRALGVAKRGLEISVLEYQIDPLRRATKLLTDICRRHQRLIRRGLGVDDAHEGHWIKASNRRDGLTGRNEQLIAFQPHQFAQSHELLGLQTHFAGLMHAELQFCLVSGFPYLIFPGLADRWQISSITRASNASASGRFERMIRR